MEYGTDKGKEKGEYNADDMPTIRIILKSQETKNLEYVANTIVKEGTNTFDAYEMRIHTRIVDIKCSPNSVSEITNFKIKPGVDINIKIWSA